MVEISFVNANRKKIASAEIAGVDLPGIARKLRFWPGEDAKGTGFSPWYKACPWQPCRGELCNKCVVGPKNSYDDGRFDVEFP